MIWSDRESAKCLVLHSMVDQDEYLDPYLNPLQLPSLVTLSKEVVREIIPASNRWGIYMLKLELLGCELEGGKPESRINLKVYREFAGGPEEKEVTLIRSKNDLVDTGTLEFRDGLPICNLFRISRVNIREQTVILTPFRNSPDGDIPIQIEMET